MKSKWYDMSCIDSTAKRMVVQLIELCYIILLHFFQPQLISHWRQCDVAIAKVYRLQRRGILNGDEATRLISAIRRQSFTEQFALGLV